MRKDTARLARRFIDDGFRARLVCVDEELTSVSFLRPADAQQWINDLAVHNIIHIHEGQAFEIVCIDQRPGNANPRSTVATFNSI